MKALLVSLCLAFPLFATSKVKFSLELNYFRKKKEIKFFGTEGLQLGKANTFKFLDSTREFTINIRPTGPKSAQTYQVEVEVLDPTNNHLSSRSANFIVGAGEDALVQKFEPGQKKPTLTLRVNPELPAK